MSMMSPSTEDRVWPSFEALAAALPGGPGYEITPTESGDWVRLVEVTADVETDRNGQRTALVEDVPRAVALSRRDAKARTALGVEHDYWDGATWWRRGQKPERDVFVNEQQATRRTLRRVVLNEQGAAPEPVPAGRARAAMSGQAHGTGSGSAAAGKE